MQITRQAVADDVACAAHLVMGETIEKTPVALIRGAPVELNEEAYGSRDFMMPPDEDIFLGKVARGRKD